MSRAALLAGHALSRVLLAGVLGVSFMGCKSELDLAVVDGSIQLTDATGMDSPRADGRTIDSSGDVPVPVVDASSPVDAEACGRTGQACCRDAVCLGSNVTCGAENRCVSCGAVGEDCCPDLKCQTGGCCRLGTFSRRYTCELGSSCPAIPACGNPGSACCFQPGYPGMCGSHEYICDASDVCVAATTCGGEGKRCCRGPLDCDRGLACDGTCKKCGGQGELCCPSYACGAANLACVRALNHCEPCGAAGQRCCVGLKCETGSTCVPDPTYPEEGFCRTTR
jgi:hypothetical protein